MTRARTVKPTTRSTKDLTPLSHRVSSDRPRSDAVLKTDGPTEDERWQQTMATLRRAAAERVLQRKESAEPIRNRELEAPILKIVNPLKDASSIVPNRSARDLYNHPERAASLLNIALREGSPEQRREIGIALAASGLVDEAINNLMEGRRENCYWEFSLLFLVAKAGEVQPLIRLIEKHPNMNLRLAIVRLLASSGGPEVLPAFRRLALNGSENGVQLALLEAVNQLSNNLNACEPVRAGVVS